MLKSPTSQSQSQTLRQQFVPNYCRMVLKSGWVDLRIVIEWGASCPATRSGHYCALWLIKTSQMMVILICTNGPFNGPLAECTWVSAKQHSVFFIVSQHFAFAQTLIAAPDPGFEGEGGNQIQVLEIQNGAWCGLVWFVPQISQAKCSLKKALDEGLPRHQTQLSHHPSVLERFAQVVGQSLQTNPPRGAPTCAQSKSKSLTTLAKRRTKWFHCVVHGATLQQWSALHKRPGKTRKGHLQRKPKEKKKRTKRIYWEWRQEKMWMSGSARFWNELTCGVVWCTKLKSRRTQKLQEEFFGQLK